MSIFSSGVLQVNEPSACAFQLMHHTGQILLFSELDQEMHMIGHKLQLHDSDAVSPRDFPQHHPHLIAELTLERVFSALCAEPDMVEKCHR